MTKVYYEGKEDKELIELYRTGNNEVVFVWVFSEKKYSKKLFFIAYGSLKVEDRAEEALHGVADDLLETALPVRTRVLSLSSSEQTVERDLVVKVKSKSIDLYRRYEKISTQMSDEDIKIRLDQQGDESFIARLEDMDQIEFVKRMLKSKYGADDVQMIDLMLMYGPGKLQPIADDLGIDTEEARKYKYRVMRRAKRILLNSEKYYEKAS